MENEKLVNTRAIKNCYKVSDTEFFYIESNYVRKKVESENGVFNQKVFSVFA